VVELKTPGEIEAMRAAGTVVARVLEAVRAAAAARTRLSELDEVARSVLAEAGASSPFLGYRPSFAPTPFPAVICTSVNDAALHGIPGRYRLASGDLLSVDCGATLDGWTADAAVSFTIGPPGAADAPLIGAVSDALRAGIAAAVPGGRLGDICAAVGSVGRAAGYGLNTDFGGHGVGRTMHEPPSVPNDGRSGRGLRLRPGLVIAIEPWFMAGGKDEYWIDDDGWTIRSADGSRAAHMEHTVAVTSGGPLVLTASTG
jgi:methionyl aminopeptidase